MSLQITEGLSHFTVPAIPNDCQTYYKRFVAEGSCQKSSTASALVVLHGGPLLGHDYCIPLQGLAFDPNISELILYDQVGCGKSTHVSRDNQSFSEDFMAINLHQLKSLVDDLQLNTTGYYLMGHCMGSLFGLTYAATHPEGLKALIVANAFISLADVRKANLQLLANFPPSVADGITHFEEYALGERKETSVSLAEYVRASEEYRRQHFNRALPPTEYWNKSKQNVTEVMDVFATINGGRVRFLWGGRAAQYNVKHDLSKIAVPTLVIKGEFDHILDFCQEPILQLVPQVRETTLKNASHMITEEAPNDVGNAIRMFLAEL